MKPETVAKLRENIPELRELITFLASELAKLHTIEDLKLVPLADRPVALEAKFWAYNAVGAILAPLLEDAVIPNLTDPKEYVA